MSVKNRPCAVTTVVSERERNLFVAMASELDIPCNAVMRHLIQYLLDKKISWFELFKLYNELPLAGTPDKIEARRMRTHLVPEQYVAFAQLTEEWGSTTAAILRRLMLLYVAGKIGRGDIW